MISFNTIGYWLLAFVAIPLVVLCGFTFWGLLASPENLTYFTTTSFAKAITHSVVLSFFTSSISLFLGALIALGFYTLKRKILRIFLILLLMISFMLQPVILLSVFQQMALFMKMDAFSQSLLISTFHLLPLCGLLFIYILSTINVPAIQNALLIAPFRYIAKSIILPQLNQFIPTLFLLLFILTFIDQEVPSILGYRTYAEDLLAQMTLMENIEQIALSALASYFLVFVFIALWHLAKKKQAIREKASFSYALQLPFKWLGAGVLSLWIVYLLWILLTLSSVFFKSEIKTLFQDNMNVISTSIGFSFMSALVTLLIAVVIHSTLEKHNKILLKTVSFGMLLFYLLIPHSLISLVLLHIYQWVGYFSIVTDYLLFFIGYIFILLPIALFVLYLFKTLEKEDSFLLFLATTKFDKWFKIILPQMFLNWLLILFIIMIFALNELSVSILLIPPGFETMIVKIYNLLHYGDKETIAFLSLVQLFFVMLCFTIIGWISKKVYK